MRTQERHFSNCRDPAAGLKKPRHFKTTRAAHGTDPPAMSSSATPDPATPMSDDILPDATAAQKSAVTQAIPGLLDDIVVTHVLRSTWLLDPADLARLSVVSRGMRHAVAATGRKVQEMDAYEAAGLGCLSALKRMHRRGSLYFESELCWHAARAPHYCNRNFDFEVLMWLRMKGCPWDRSTQCMVSKILAIDGNLEGLKWLRLGGCAWDSETCALAAGYGHFELLKWACERVPAGRVDVRERGVSR